MKNKDHYSKEVTNNLGYVHWKDKLKEEEYQPLLDKDKPKENK